MCDELAHSGACFPTLFACYLSFAALSGRCWTSSSTQCHYSARSLQSLGVPALGRFGRNHQAPVWIGIAPGTVCQLMPQLVSQFVIGARTQSCGLGIDSTVLSLFYCFGHNDYISQPFSGGMVLYIYLYHITWSWLRTLILVFLFSSAPDQLLTTIVRLFSGGMVLVLMVSVNTVR